MNNLISTKCVNGYILWEYLTNIQALTKTGHFGNSIHVYGSKD